MGAEMGLSGAVVQRAELAPEAALDLVKRAVEQARSLGLEVAAAVVDPAGHPIALWRTEDVVRPAIGFALDKAWTAATLRKATTAMQARADENPSFRLGLANRERVMVWGGGVAVYADGVCVGGLGVSGATDEEDIACAKAAIEGLGLTAR